MLAPVNPFTYQLPMQTLIVGRDPRFECAGSPRQLHDGSANALPGAQQCAENACSSPLRRSDEFVCGTISPIMPAIGCCIATVVATAQSAITLLVAIGSGGWPNYVMLQNGFLAEPVMLQIGSLRNQLGFVVPFFCYDLSSKTFIFFGQLDFTRKTTIN